jgi:hypothetical protein
MYVPVYIIRNSYVIDHIVSVEVEVVDMRVLVIEISLESFKSLRLLEKLHNRVEVQIVTRETQVLLRIILCPD